MRKQIKQNAHARRIQRNAIKKSKKDAARNEFEAGEWQRERRANAARLRRQLNVFADNLGLLALIARGERP